MKLPMRYDVNQVIQGEKKFSLVTCLFTAILLGSTNDKIQENGCLGVRELHFSYFNCLLQNFPHSHSTEFQKTWIVKNQRPSDREKKRKRKRWSGFTLLSLWDRSSGVRTWDLSRKLNDWFSPDKTPKHQTTFETKGERLGTWIKS